VITVTVGTTDLRHALQAVTPHAHTDHATPWHRVRLEAGPVNLTVTASNGHTCGHAIVSVEDGDPEGVWDMTPLDVKEILTLFKASGASTDDEKPEEQLRFDVGEEHATVTDVGGLFEGKSLVLPRTPTGEGFANYARLIRDAMEMTTRSLGLDSLVTNASQLTAFGAAGKAYGEPLTITPVGRTLLVTCGESFVGLMLTPTPTEDDTAKYAGWRRDWLQRLDGS
jgi:hypothetical protein